MVDNIQRIQKKILIEIKSVVDLKGGKMPEPDHMMGVLNECKVTEKATDADVQGFLAHKIPQNRSGKCVMACVFEKNGDVMSIALNFLWLWVQYRFFNSLLEQIKNGKINGEGIKSSLANSPGPKPFTNQMISACESIEDADRCELAVKFVECLMHGVANKGQPKQ